MQAERAAAQAKHFKKLVTVLADDAYLQESIRAPSAAVVEGFQPIMPVSADLSEAEVAALVQFIKGVR